MRTLVAALALMFLAAPADLAKAQSVDAEIVTAIDTAADALDEAFTVGDPDGIKSLMTADHIAVTPYYAGPLSLDEQIAVQPDLNYAQTVIGEASTALLAPNVVLRTFVAELKGSFKGKPLPTRVFVNETFINRNGEWLERFYQVTALTP